ncbi:MAG: ABC transporter permease [Armatimonadetes bacterium]|nr:ABC transporter permease [Armatimonadota bacterium]
MALRDAMFIFGLFQNFVLWLGEIWLLLVECFRQMKARQWLLTLTLDQIATNGLRSLPIVLLTVSAAGAVLALYTAHELASRGGERFVGWIIAYTIFREVCPVATGLVIAARVGSAYAAEIGTMKVTEQIDALRVMGVSPIAFLVLPRLLACIVITPSLCLLGDVAGVIGGYFVSVEAGVKATIYLSSIRHFLDFGDLFWGMVKTIPFGMLIALVSCHRGLKVEGGALGVGKATTEAVVISFVLIYATDYVLSALLPR